MKKSNNLDEAILNICTTIENNEYGDSVQNEILYSRWKTRYAETIGGFYADFIKPRLPKKEVVLKWHKLLMDYSQREGAVFPIRGGYSHNEDKSKEKLRRGWLVRVNDGIFSYTFTDNYFPAYIYKMALDGFCPELDEFYEYMTGISSDPSGHEKGFEEKDITWLNGKSIKNVHDDTEGKDRRFMKMPISYGRISSTELVKNVYVNTTPAPTCPLGDCGYKHAHVFGVRGEYKIDSDTIKQWEEINDKIALGDDSDYTWKDDINNYAWDRTVESGEADGLRKIVVAHFLRLCDPINHFLSPKQGCNKFTKDNGDYSLDIGEYNNLLSYLMFLRENEFGDAYRNFKTEALAPSDSKSADCSTDIIHVVYHEKKQEAADRKNREDKKRKSAEKKVDKAKKDAETAMSKAASTIRSPKGAKRGSSTEWADFDAYAPKNYSKLIRDIMDELSISDIHELETRIDEAIDFCTDEMNVAKTNGDKKREDYYRNHRCALNKYKCFMKL